MDHAGPGRRDVRAADRRRAPRLAADSGSLFRSDGTDGQWIYNWGTAKTDANKQFTIGVRLDDGQVYSAVIGLR